MEVIMIKNLKSNHTIGCCGIDCGLCPRYHSNGETACPGCGGEDFLDKHPICAVLNCCVIKNGYEVCSECGKFPCNKFESAKTGYDSFVTHKNIFPNHEYILNFGLNNFINQQKFRIRILKDFLSNYNDGRSKSYFCVCCSLIPLHELVESHSLMKTLDNSISTKDKNKYLKEKLNRVAEIHNINLKLNIKRN